MSRIWSANASVNNKERRTNFWNESRIGTFLGSFFRFQTESGMEEDIDLTSWITSQARQSTRAMERAISATELIRRREVFGQTIIPAIGSVLASPSIGDWNPAPDYFFHWLRDAAAVMRALVALMQVDDSNTRGRWVRHFNDIVRFNLSLSELDGARLVQGTEYFEAIQPEARQFLRPSVEIETLRGERLLGEPRFNPDGTIDIFRWSRPQHDGPALRALACLKYIAAGGAVSDELQRLLGLDLEFTLHHAGEPCVGPWEEESSQHYYVSLVQLGALLHGRHFMDDAAAVRRAERNLRTILDRHWSERHQVYTVTWPMTANSADDLVDSVQVLAVLDADLPEGPHSIVDPRVRKTVDAIEQLFAREFPINAAREAPALGRSRRDHYFGGGAWYLTTLAAASYYYRLGLRAEKAPEMLRRHGDSFMATVRALTPADGSLSEQVDRATGLQTSTQHLTWSYAAFVCAAAARTAASYS
jgi:glucoamylase